MSLFICTACGTQYPESAAPPAQCTICEEERQYVPAGGQGWTTLEKLSKSHRNGFHEYEPGLIGIGAGFACEAILINEQRFTKTANIWGVGNNEAGTNSNRIVVFRKTWRVAVAI